MSSLDNLPKNSGVVICGHGSRSTSAVEEFKLLASNIKFRYPDLNIEYGFLEYAEPNIHMALDRLIERGVTNIFAVPGMLFAATHAKNDIPSVLTTYQEKYPRLNIKYGQELGIHHEMISAFEYRILQALGGGNGKLIKIGKLYDTLLVTVGRGTSVATANADVEKINRIVTENLGFGWSATLYSGVTFPSVGVGLKMLIKLGFKKIVVAPYFLFSGRLIDRIYAYVDLIASANPDILFYKAGYLKDHPSVINTFIARIMEMLSNDSQSNKLMTDFHKRLARGDVEVHHHHAEFKNDDVKEQYSHESLSAHQHSHTPYKHIAHPFGPRTMIDENVCCCFMEQFPHEVIEDERRKNQRLSVIQDHTRYPKCKQ